MTGTQPGWYPDPTRRHELRYWDGGAWTPHVATTGQTSTDPLDGGPVAQGNTDPQPAGGQERRVLLDTQVRTGFTHRRLFVDEQAIWDGSDAHPFDGVTAISFSSTRVSAAGASNMLYKVHLWRGKKRETITFEGGGTEERAAYEALTKAVLDRVGKPILADLVAAVDRGEEVELAGWTLSLAGARQGKKSFPWSADVRFQPDQQGFFTVFATVPGQKEERIGLHGADSPNGALVPIVFNVLASRGS
ncbi:MAG: DUF2510 domain-containing protein [Actinobacteria bacterium]|nr:DUF2510 domain-containing protein [Actinomycetota bacterium]